MYLHAAKRILSSGASLRLQEATWGVAQEPSRCEPSLAERESQEPIAFTLPSGVPKARGVHEVLGSLGSFLVGFLDERMRNKKS